MSPYVKQMTSASSMHEAGCSELVLGDTQREETGREVGRGFRMGDICAESCRCMVKTTTIL